MASAITVRGSDRAARAEAAELPLPEPASVGATPRAAPSPDVFERVAAASPAARASSDQAHRAPRREGDGYRFASGTAVHGDHVELGGARFPLGPLPGRGTAGALNHLARDLVAWPTNPMAGVSAEFRAQLATTLLAYLELGKARGEAGTLAGASLRGGASALLVLIAQAASEAEGPLQRRIATALLARAATEAVPALRQVMIANLRAMPAGALDADSRATRQALVDELLQPKPLSQTWISPDGELRVAASVMDEFWRSELGSWRKHGYEIEEHSGRRATATKTLIDPDGREVRVRVALSKRSVDVLNPLADPKTPLVFYSGHAELGGVTKQALKSGPRRATGPKLVALFACRTKQHLPALARRFPNAHLLVSRQGTYGHDDRLVAQELIEGIVAGRGYEAIRRRTEALDLWERDNYVFPHQAARLAHLDLNGDGKTDGGQRVLVYDPRERREVGRSASMRPHPAPGAAADHDPARVVDAVAWLNTVFNYWAEAEGSAREKGLCDRLASGGWFESTDPREVVRITQEGAGARRVLRVAVNVAYAAQETDALAVLMTYAAALELFALTRPEEDPRESRLRAMAMAGEYVSYLVEYSDVGDALLRQLAKRFGLPAGLSLDAVQRAMLADKHQDCTTPVLRALERELERGFLQVSEARQRPAFRRYVGAALEVLRGCEAPIARRVYDAILRGEVKVDELDEARRRDFERLQADFRREGIELRTVDSVQPAQGRETSLRRVIDGFQYGNRLYVSPGLAPEGLARTLVHEVVHIWNESERRYREPRDILVEEYRSFYAEALLDGGTPSPAACRRIKKRVIDEYKLEGLRPEDIPDEPTGWLASPKEAESAQDSARRAA